MSIEFRCVGCAKLLRVPEASGGKKARCPDCGHIQAIPDPAAPPDAVANPSEEPTFHVSSAAGEDPFGRTPSNTTVLEDNPFAEGSPFAAEATPHASTNPYQAPRAGAVVPPTFSHAAIRSRVEGPAQALSIVAGIAMALSGVSTVVQVVMFLIGEVPLEDFAVSLAGVVFVLAFYGMVFHGASHMKQLRNYPLAVTASLLAMLPCSGCCLLGLPIGIWSLTVLFDPSVRAAFR